MSLLIDRFGVEPILGRPQLLAREVRRMAVAENVERWFAERAQHPNIAAWAEQHPVKATVLAFADQSRKSLPEE